MVTLALIADYLQIPGVVAHRVRSIGRRFSGPRLWTAEEPHPRKEFVYLVDVDAPDWSPALIDPSCEYVVSGGGDPRLADVSYVFAPAQGEGFASLFARVQGIFERVQVDYCEKLLASALKDRDIENLLEIAYPFFENPMYLADSAFMLLARTKSVRVQNPTPQWVSIAEKGALDPAIVSRIKTSDIKRYDEMRRASFMHTIDAEGVRNIIAHIEKNGTRIANLAIIECDAPMKDYHLAMADFLVECILYVIEGLNDFQKLTGTLYEKWLLLLLQGEVATIDQIAPHLRQLKWNEGDYYQVAVIDFLEKPARGADSLNYSWRMISSILIGHKCFIYDNAIVALLHFTKAGYDTRVFSVPLDKFIAENGLRCAFSVPFRSILDTPIHYAQAQRAKRFATADAPMLEYTDVLADDLIWAEPFASSWKANVCPEVAALAQQDCENGTNMVETLYVYLLCDRSLKESSARLNIHRNTLVYRIRKIQEGCRFDFDDPERRLTVILSCRICLGGMKLGL